MRPGNGALAQWTLDGHARDSAHLGARHGTLTGGSYTPGAVGQAVRLDGVDDVVTAPNAVRTDTSFTVSAWLRPDRAPAQDATFTALSQDGTVNSGFYLGYRQLAGGGVWEASYPTHDAVDRPGDEIVRSTSAAVGAWTHVAAVYDAPRRQIRLYVNGTPAGTAARTLGFAAAGDFVIGRGRWHGGDANRWPGAVDEVRVHDRELSDAEVAGLVSHDNVQSGHWKFDEADGATAGNTVAGGSAGVLRDGARFTPDGAVRGAVDLAGGQVGTGAPVVRTDQSFSVATWVRPGATADATALAQLGTHTPGFRLGQRGGRWEWALASADAAERPADAVVTAATGPTAGSWTHLAGVHDAAAGEIRLYVDGVLAGRAPRSTAFDAAGELRITYPGAVDELRAYTRAVGEAEIRGMVSRDAVAAGHWPLDGDAADASGRGRHGTASGGPGWSGGQSAYPAPDDLAAHLDGADDVITAPHAVDTDRSFAVTAWARLDRAGSATVVAQDGATGGAFRLHATADGKWAFAVPRSDGGADDLAAGGAAQVGAWTHLVGVHDAAARQVHLYVNGVLTASAAHPTAWNHPTGGLRIGAGFAGSVDDVTAHPRVLFADEIRTLAGRDLTLVHHWRMDEPGGTAAADSVGNRPAALAGAAFAPGRSGNAAAFDGVDDAATTTGVDFATDASFTVAGWVFLADSACAAPVCRRDAVSLAGAHASKFRLGHVIDDDRYMLGHWIFEMPESDAPGARVTQAAVDTAPSDVGKWVHLVGVYDAPAKQLHIYVNGTRRGEGSLQNASRFGTELTVGRGKAGGAATAHWPGRVDDVRVHTGALDSGRVAALHRSYPAELPPAALPVADAGHWPLDETGGATAADTSAKARSATVVGDPTRTGGRSGRALWLNGTSQYAQTAGPVLTTTRAFTVTAWVYLADLGRDQIAVSQDGSRTGAFAFGYNAGVGRWAVAAPKTDTDNAETVFFTSDAAAAGGEWAHLAVTYDPRLRQLRLYVNGYLANAQVGAQVFAASGPLAIGRGKWNGAHTGLFSGGVDDVRAYAKALTAGEVRMVHDDAQHPVVGSWRFTDGGGADASYRANHAVVQNATTTTGVHGGALRFTGTGEAVTPEPGASMRDSVTVSAWARLDRTDVTQTVLGQDGARTSGFVLQYRAGLNRWVFGAPNQDADGATVLHATQAAAPKPGWTHLAGVYDHPARQLRLYVDGALAGVRDDVAIWYAGGGLTIGRGKRDGLPADRLTGAVDEVRVDLGAVPAAELAARAAWPAPAPGQLGRFVNDAGDRYTGSTSAPVRAGYRFEAALGVLPRRARKAPGCCTRASTARTRSPRPTARARARWWSARSAGCGRRPRCPGWACRCTAATPVPTTSSPATRAARARPPSTSWATSPGTRR
ncbi:LamG domain-containing protein [Actinokineospora soli]|uniref:LamG domain-containing protein n=1 Tax=Actinokineospora soli TaxID=1048753 RepID=A0ABW2TWY8_9PSEU